MATREVDDLVSTSDLDIKVILMIFEIINKTMITLKYFRDWFETAINAKTIGKCKKIK